MKAPRETARERTRFFRLSPFARPTLRDDTTVQFGADATRCGLIVAPDARRTAVALTRMKHAARADRIVGMLTEAGFTPAEARELLSDMIAFGLLVPARAPAVTVVGDSPLADETARQLAQADVQVRRFFGTLGELPPRIPVVIAGRGELRAEEVLRHPGPVVPAAIIDHRGVVGPLRLDGAGPCPMCCELHTLDADPAWTRVAGPCSSGDPAVVAATAAAAGLVARALAGARSGPPGTAEPRLHPGWRISIDLFSHHDPGGGRADVLRPHPGCPVCWDHGQR